MSAWQLAQDQEPGHVSSVVAPVGEPSMSVYPNRPFGPVLALRGASVVTATTDDVHLTDTRL